MLYSCHDACCVSTNKSWKLITNVCLSSLPSNYFPSLPFCLKVRYRVNEQKRERLPQHLVQLPVWCSIKNNSVVDLIKCDSRRLQLFFEFRSKVLVMNQDDIISCFERIPMILVVIPSIVFDKDQSMRIEDKWVFLFNEFMSFITMTNDITLVSCHESQTEGDVNVIPTVDD